MRQFPRYILKKYLGTRGRGGTSGYKLIPKVYEVCPVVGWVLFHFLADGKTDRFSKTKSVKKWAAITLKKHGGAHCSPTGCWKCP